MSTHKIVIKKYSDRRLYDTANRRYVNLDDIARMIREGIDVEVVDASTGKDLTRLVLTQIIVDDSRDGECALPLKLLRQLVIASDRATHDFLSWYLETALELYKNAGAAFRMLEARSAVSNPMEYLRRLVAPDRDSGEIEELRRQVRELEARLEAFERRSAARKP
ncbi:MAG TPA: polyhydroxyalkanoate synthesis regulator DNA-binding domain-containing protein [Bryobacteraceae bacterium]|nr:polyhydroxyalkanoate synthesis regulator DNA-binding domain-containing protein [Bryobacteraceae bacterium]HOQ46586.1 polyhydroxyalkanoate synthesis regulator DNA-binding domain-containing protein [Bryobacteraceae bacterium]HPQ16725.1 polyhydroxyalkanoate synthesis regulator DNA-binding domain-containing protein [Bryobacteraceae bacterium]HPU73981.1 polyhydroxyalkanoate synthesis regulator DNA-binding domain-containing protein [Bryobacteraceae bacterium]